MKLKSKIFSLLVAFLLFTSSIQEIQLTEDHQPQQSRNFLEINSVKATKTIEQHIENPTIEIPQSEEELAALMHNHDKFHFGKNTLFGNQYIDNSSVEISLESFTEIHCCVDETVYVGANVTYKDLITELKKHKYALEDVPESVHSNVISSVINGDHSGRFYGGVLANNVTELVILMPNGNKRYFTPRDIEFTSVLINFGFSGAVIGMTLKVVREFTVLKCIYQNLLHFDFVRKLHLLFFAKSYSWYFLDLKTMKWEVHHVFRDDKIVRKNGNPHTPPIGIIY